MEFKDFDKKTQDDITALVKEYLVIAQDVIQKEKFIAPTLTIKINNQQDEIISLETDDDDLDEAFDLAVEKLKQTDFACARLVFTTQILSHNGGIANAIKTFVFVKGGAMLTFVAPYVIKGLFSKKVFIGDTILEDITENIFE